MAIKNYTTSISVEKTAMEIQKGLADHKACAVMTEYDEGVLTHISFRLKTPEGVIPFRLPANIDRVYVCIQRSEKVPKRLRTREQAARVAWRIVKDWVAAQLAIVEAEMVDMVEVFLPYAQGSDGETVYDRFKKSPQLLLLSS